MNNNNNNGQQKRKPIYKVKNPDPMSNVRDMGRLGIRLMRDISKGKFDLDNDGNVFSNPDFVRATIKEVEKKLLDANIHIMAINFTYAYTTSNDVKDLLIRDMRTAEAYTLIYTTLGQILNNNGDIRYLKVLMNHLPRYRYNL